MKPGSLVETVGNFEQSRKTWGFSYPKTGDVLTVSTVTPHNNNNVRMLGIVLLNFVELPGLIGICDKTVDGSPNFVELLLPDEIMELLEAPMTVPSLMFSNIS